MEAKRGTNFGTWWKSCGRPSSIDFDILLILATHESIIKSYQLYTVMNSFIPFISFHAHLEGREFDLLRSTSNPRSRHSRLPALSCGAKRTEATELETPWHPHCHNALSVWWILCRFWRRFLLRWPWRTEPWPLPTFAGVCQLLDCASPSWPQWLRIPCGPLDTGSTFTSHIKISRGDVSLADVPSQAPRFRSDTTALGCSSLRCPVAPSQDLRVDDVDVSFGIFTTELPAASCVKASQATNQHFTIQRLKVKEKGSKTIWNSDRSNHHSAPANCSVSRWSRPGLLWKLGRHVKHSSSPEVWPETWNELPNGRALEGTVGHCRGCNKPLAQTLGFCPEMMPCGLITWMTFPSPSRVVSAASSQLGPPCGLVHGRSGCRPPTIPPVKNYRVLRCFFCSHFLEHVAQDGSTWANIGLKMGQHSLKMGQHSPQDGPT